MPASITDAHQYLPQPICSLTAPPTPEEMGEGKSCATFQQLNPHKVPLSLEVIPIQELIMQLQDSPERWTFFVQLRHKLHLIYKYKVFLTAT